MGLSSFIQSRIRHWKGLYKLHFQYPGRFPTSRIETVLPPNVEAMIGPGSAVEVGARVSPHLKELGHHVYLGRNAWIAWCSRIGHYCSISHDTNIGLLNHALDHVSTSPVFYEKRKGWVDKDSFDPLEKGMVEIGHDVLISAKAIVLGGVKIGTGSVIAAGSVVNRDVPPYAIVGGTPARVIKYRFEEGVIDRLLASEWWLKPEAELKKLAPYFSNPEEFLARL